MCCLFNAMAILKTLRVNKVSGGNASGKTCGIGNATVWDLHHVLCGVEDGLGERGLVGITA